MSVDQDRLPSRPLRNWFLAWHIHTGDPPEVIARGFDLPVPLVFDLLADQAPLMLAEGEAIEICRSVRVAPADLWDVRWLRLPELHLETEPLWADVSPVTAAAVGPACRSPSMRVRHS